MTDLMLFRRQQRLKKQLKKLKEQLEKISGSLHVPPLQKIEKLNSALEQFKAYLYSHTHKDYLTKKQLPKSYVHPRKGVCPQKPRVHKHLTKHIVGLKIPNPYDFERLKEDHPKLKEPYLHQPEKHLHPAQDITGRIKPEQIQRKGLDADMVDGKHAKDLVKRVYAGGGPHGSQHETGGGDKVHFADLEHDEEDSTLHDAFTSTPHLSQVEKDQIHDRQHALDSAQDHIGIITDSQHGDKTTIPDAHHVKTADDEVFGLLQWGLLANRPAPGIAYRFYYAYDTLQLFLEDGTAWGEIARGETATRLAQLSEKAHGSLTGIGTSDHHAKLHATSHHKGGDDIIGRLLALKFGAEGSTTTSLTYVTIADSDIALNPALFNVTGTLFVKFIYHIKNSGAYYTYIRVLRQNAGTPVAGSEKYKYGAGWSIVETSWINFSAENVAESYQLQMKVTGGTGEFNSALMILSPVQL